METSNLDFSLDELMSHVEHTLEPNESHNGDLDNILYKPGVERTRFLQSVLQRIYPDMSGYWAGNYDLKGIEKNCIEVSEWFGFSPNEDVVKGNCSIEEQVHFWWNIILTLQELGDFQRYYVENTDIPMFGQLKTLVLRSNVIIELIRFSDTLETIQPALQTLTNIVGVGSTEIERIRIVLHEIASKDMLFVCLTEQVNHEKRYRDLVVQTFNLMDSFLKLYFVGLPKEGCVKIRQAPQRHGYEVHTMLNQIEEVSKNIRKMISSIYGLNQVFMVVNKKIADVAEFRPAST